MKQWDARLGCQASKEASADGDLFSGNKWVAYSMMSHHSKWSSGVQLQDDGDQHHKPLMQLRVWEEQTLVPALATVDPARALSLRPKSVKRKQLRPGGEQYHGTMHGSLPPTTRASAMPW